MIMRVPQVSTSVHSGHGLNAVSLAHGRGANGPSIMRMTDPMVIVEGGRLPERPQPSKKKRFGLF